MAKEINPENLPESILPAKPGWHNTLFLGGLYFYAISCAFSISLSQISLGFALIGLLSGIYHGEHHPKILRIERPFFFLAVAGFFSIFFAVNLDQSIFELKKFLIIVVFWISYWPRLNFSQQRKILGLIIAFGALSAIIGIVKMFFIEGSNNRVSGFFSMPITFGECQMLYILVTFAWLNAGEKHSGVRKWLWLAAIAQVAGLITSFTRGAFIGLGLGVCSLIRLTPKRIFALGLLTVLFLTGMATIAHLFKRKDVFRFSSENPDSLSNIRLTIWQKGLNIIKESPIFGVGMNNVKPHYRKRVSDLEEKNNQVFGHLHNTFLQFWAMTGLLGFTILWWFLIECIQFCRELPKGISDPWQARLSGYSSALLIAFFGSGITEYSFGDEEVAMLAFFLFGLLANPFQSSTDS